MRAIRFIIFILVLLGLIWLIILLFQSVFSSSDNSSTTDITTPELTSYADTSVATSMLIDGPIVANQEHTSVLITVEREQSKIEIMSGYNGRVTAQQAFANTTEGYRQFLAALERLNYTKGNDDPELQDSAGSCPFGNRYTFKLGSSSELLMSLWTTDCSGGGGTFEGDFNDVRNLFLAQIPDEQLGELTSNIDL